jgi:hypothetical protein
MQIYLHRDGQQLGPFTIEQVRGELVSGTIHGEDLAWHDGIPNWIPLSQMPEFAVAAPPPTVTAAPPVSAPVTTAAPGQRVQVRLKDGRTLDVDAAEFKKAKRNIGAKNMLYGALWCGGGLVVTGISYSMATSGSGGGTYFVTWGAVIFGAYQFVKGLVQYLRA